MGIWPLRFLPVPVLTCLPFIVTTAICAAALEVLPADQIRSGALVLPLKVRDAWGTLPSIWVRLMTWALQVSSAVASALVSVPVLIVRVQ